MNPKQIEEAVTIKDNIIIDEQGISVIYNDKNIPEIKQKLDRLVSLGKLYLQASEVMPKKKETWDCNHPYIHIQNKNGFKVIDNDTNKGFNQCHDEFVLWLTKRLEGVKRYEAYHTVLKETILRLSADELIDLILGREGK